MFKPKFARPHIHIELLTNSSPNHFFPTWFNKGLHKPLTFFSKVFRIQQIVEQVKKRRTIYKITVFT